MANGQLHEEPERDARVLHAGYGAVPQAVESDSVRRLLEGVAWMVKIAIKVRRLARAPKAAAGRPMGRPFPLGVSRAAQTRQDPSEERRSNGTRAHPRARRLTVLQERPIVLYGGVSSSPRT